VYILQSVANEYLVKIPGVPILAVEGNPRSRPWDDPRQPRDDCIEHEGKLWPLPGQPFTFAWADRNYGTYRNDPGPEELKYWSESMEEMALDWPRYVTEEQDNHRRDPRLVFWQASGEKEQHSSQLATHRSESSRNDQTSESAQATRRTELGSGQADIEVEVERKFQEKLAEMRRKEDEERKRKEERKETEAMLQRVAQLELGNKKWQKASGGKRNVPYTYEIRHEKEFPGESGITNGNNQCLKYLMRGNAAGGCYGRCQRDHDVYTGPEEHKCKLTLHWQKKIMLRQKEVECSQIWGEELSPYTGWRRRAFTEEEQHSSWDDLYEQRCIYLAVMKNKKRAFNEKIMQEVMEEVAREESSNDERVPRIED